MDEPGLPNLKSAFNLMHALLKKEIVALHEFEGLAPGFHQPNMTLSP